MGVATTKRGALRNSQINTGTPAISPRTPYHQAGLKLRQVIFVRSEKTQIDSFEHRKTQIVPYVNQNWHFDTP